MSAPKKWTDEQVEAEISRLKGSDHVKLAAKEKQIKNKRRNYMWNLQFMEARGKQLESMGFTVENMEEKLFGPVEDSEYEE